MTKNTASQKIGAQLVSATDGSAFTSSVTVSVTGDAGTQATGSVGSGACTHEGNGYHTYAPAQAETNYDLIAFTFTGTGAVPVTVQVFTTGSAKSLVNVPANVTQLLGTAWLTPGTAGTPDVNTKLLGGTSQTGRDIGTSVLLSAGTGTGQVNLSSGAVPVKGNVLKAASFTKFMFMMTDSTNHAPATGKTVTATIAKDGGSFASLSSGDSVTEIANGIYEVDLNGTDTNANNLILRFTATGCDDTFERIVTFLA